MVWIVIDDGGDDDDDDDDGDDDDDDDDDDDKHNNDDNDDDDDDATHTTSDRWRMSIKFRHKSTWNRSLLRIVQIGFRYSTGTDITLNTCFQFTQIKTRRE